MKPSHPSRREFLQTTAVAASALAFPHIGSSQVLGANDRIGFAVIGCGGQGTGHLSSLVKRGKDDKGTSKNPVFGTLSMKRKMGGML